MLTATTTFRSAQFIKPEQRSAPTSASSTVDEISSGLKGKPASISPKYLYDALGSRLFDAITELAEYYPTRTEAAIFSAYGSEMAMVAGVGRTLVDLGAGNCEKAERLFTVLKPARYVAVDISVDHLQHSLDCLQRVRPDIDMVGLGLDFSHELVLPRELGDEPRTLFYPGSSIGNFSPDAALNFLQQAHRESQGGSLLIGVDLVKAADVLEPAYDDALGVTAAFNLNMLNHLNRLVGADFKLADWKHVALFNAQLSRIEMHLEAKRDVLVRWRGGERQFKHGERIHTENSYKYQLDNFKALLLEAGFSSAQCWTDEKQWFAVFCAEA